MNERCPKCGSTWIYVERLTREGQVLKCSKCTHEWTQHEKGSKDAQRSDR